MNDLFLRACRREPVERTPVWLMRQAGRYLPEYRALRAKRDFLTMTRTPDLAAEVTMQPIRRFGFDAAILFADIMTPIAGHGVRIEFAPGPIVEKPIREPKDIERLLGFEPETAVPEILETVAILKDELEVPLIGFVGAPWTLACYLVDGKGTKDFPLTRSALHGRPAFAETLLAALGKMVAAYAAAQVDAGAAAVQVFDTWADLLGAAQYRRYATNVLGPLHEAIRATGVPVIHYSPAFSLYPGAIDPSGADVVAVDWKTDLGHIRDCMRTPRAVQGNLDPMALFAPPDRLREEIRRVLEHAGDAPGHVFNLGHGIHKDTPLGNVEVLVEAVREETSR